MLKQQRQFWALLTENYLNTQMYLSCKQRIMIKRKIPDYIGKYQIQSVLGRGAAGVVYKAIDPSIGRIIAIKTVRKSLLGTDDASILTRFQQEARAVGLLTHPGIVPIYE